MFACTKILSSLQHRATGPAGHGQPRMMPGCFAQVMHLHPSLLTPQHCAWLFVCRGPHLTGGLPSKRHVRNPNARSAWGHVQGTKPPSPLSPFTFRPHIPPRSLGIQPQPNHSIAKSSSSLFLLAARARCLYNQAGAALHAARISLQTSPSKAQVPKALRHKVSFCLALTSGQKLGFFVLFLNIMLLQKPNRLKAQLISKSDVYLEHKSIWTLNKRIYMHTWMQHASMQIHAYRHILDTN